MIITAELSEIHFMTLYFPSAVYNEDVSKSFRTGLLQQELQMVELSATRCSCIAIL